jgi:hypothetical protein
MKVYRVRMPYFDGDHDHGYYESPFFLKKEDAEAFKQALIEVYKQDPYDERVWDSDDGSWEGMGPEDAYIDEIEIVENWDGVLQSAKKYLHITWT